jgi:hypothetical protein
MKLLRIVPLALAFVASISYADAPPAGSGGTASDADVKRYLAFLDKLVDTVVADKDSCPKMGTDINSLIDANKDLLAMAQKAKADGKQLPPDATQHIKDLMGKMMGPIMGCKDDPTVKTAIQRLSLAGPRAQPNH